jgi:hypothetical protein
MAGMTMALASGGGGMAGRVGGAAGGAVEERLPRAHALYCRGEYTMARGMCEEVREGGGGKEAVGGGA